MPSSALPQFIALDSSGDLYGSAEQALGELSRLAVDTGAPGLFFYDAHDDKSGESIIHCADLIRDAQAIAGNSLLEQLDGGGYELAMAIRRSFEEANRLGYLDGEQPLGDWLILSDFGDAAPTAALERWEACDPSARFLLSRFQRAPAIYALCEEGHLEDAQAWAAEIAAWRGAPVIAMTLSDHIVRSRVVFEARSLSETLAPASPTAPSASSAGPKARI